MVNLLGLHIPSPISSGLLNHFRSVGFMGTVLIGLSASAQTPGKQDPDVEKLPALEINVSSMITPDLATSVLTRSDFSRFGENNAASALNRLPGVSIEQSHGEARYVIIRGIDPNLNGVTVNGVSIANGSPENRATQMDVLELEGFEQIELTKVLRPDQPADAIGGQINFTSPSAFDYPSGHREFGTSVNYDHNSAAGGANAYLRYSRLSSDETGGIFLTGSTTTRPIGSTVIEADPFVSLSSGFAPGGAVDFDTFDIQRTRVGLSFNAEQKASRNAKWFLRGSFTNLSDELWRHRSSLEFDDAIAAGSIVLSNQIVSFQDDPQTLADDMGIAQEIRHRDTDIKLQLLSLGGEFRMQNWEMDFSLNHSFASEDEITTEAAYESTMPPASLEFSTAQTYHPRVTYAGGIDLTQTNNFELDEIVRESLLSDESNWTGQWNLFRKFEDAGLVRLLKTGTHFQVKDKESAVEVNEYLNGPAGFGTLIPNRSASPLGFPQISRSTIREFLANQSAFQSSRDQLESVASDYTSTEDIYAAYAMTELGWKTYALTAGARWEQTDFNSISQNFDPVTSTITPVAGKKSFARLLPGIHLNYRSKDTINSTDAWTWSAAWTNTLGRPGFEETKAGVLIEDDEVEVGNPQLDPLQAVNFDFTVTYERPSWGRFGLSVFHKQLRDFIYSIRREFDFDLDGELDEVIEFINGTSGDISGLELSYEKTLWGDPHSSSHLSLNSSLTLVDSQATYFGATTADPLRVLPFVKQSDSIAKLELNWVHRRWQSRLTYHRRSGYLDEIGEDGDDFQVEAYGQLDLSVHFAPSDRWSVYARLQNLTREPFRANWTSSQRIAEFEDLGITAVLGVTWQP